MLNKCYRHLFNISDMAHTHTMSDVTVALQLGRGRLLKRDIHIIYGAAPPRAPRGKGRESNYQAYYLTVF